MNSLFFSFVFNEDVFYMNQVDIKTKWRVYNDKPQFDSSIHVFVLFQNGYANFNMLHNYALLNW